eukprot:CAMPEP_0118638404 /NCGR_PEP_ID=MMETSP0785-20121206/3663_1 /TAXON_ID=91992 /ORGANISM="Bolidomonas pacifica, Strain CCMP 1866" /LENGTH=184 /DNA_ID=CAMNT_0006529645 /DNA_START=119 /DNA_END=673 /DNA_ORIENTATION=-
MNSMISCPYCTDLHTNLGRIAGLTDPFTLNSCKGELKAIEKLTTNEKLLAISEYCIAFHAAGGPPSTKHADKLLSVLGTPSRCTGVTSLCWFLHWGGTSGNTLNDFYSRLFSLRVASAQFAFGVVFGLWYTPLFAVIVGVSKALTALPTKGPKVISQGLGVVLGVVGSVWIVPVGVLGGLMGFR